MSDAIRIITGHLAMFQTSTAVSPMPSGPATASTTGPVITRPIASTARSTTITSVTRTWNGRSFQNGRPSRTS